MSAFVELDGVWFNIDHIVAWQESDQKGETLLHTVEPIGHSWKLKMHPKDVADAIRLAGAHIGDLR